jgi:hypothetical protein
LFAEAAVRTDCPTAEPVVPLRPDNPTPEELSVSEPMPAAGFAVAAVVLEPTQSQQFRGV